ncbi:MULTISPECIES: helix-turn-helix domain-containing protein [Bacillus cereus group]|uniref:helix-turn-helix domain-containing protein n=1 Tax=Bacillus cereus group TaxID=86661 RepID=UPI000BF81404|nr:MULTISPECIES: helix-turn-helix transcriptional regulator [Bacillus cereus group]PER22399.1 transcriptional regulator [Bacillus cereus]PEX96092.1 transcriptional regulator [Bacillus cereus]PEY92529.1 transcriptional regulator [Bacillus cereus]PFJ46028.1 transcriptional regulator [Bacillus cereus]PFZ91250.1 transcriptional regulator [Bacillus wiedmannii]
MELGSKLKELRKKNNYSQQQIAEILHVTAQAVSKWENNKSVPDITTLVQISDLYNVSLDYLIKSDKQLQNKLSIRKVHLRMINLLIVAFILAIFLFISLLIKAEFFLYQHSLGGWLMVGLIFLFMIFAFLSLYCYITVRKKYFVFLWSTVFTLSCIIFIGLFYNYIIQLLF